MEHREERPPHDPNDPRGGGGTGGAPGPEGQSLWKKNMEAAKKEKGEAVEPEPAASEGLFES